MAQTKNNFERRLQLAPSPWSSAARSFAYTPKLNVLRASFRLWHVETLLNQASQLANTCIQEVREYSSLDFAWTQFATGLASQEAEVAADEAREAENPKFRSGNFTLPKNVVS